MKELKNLPAYFLLVVLIGVLYLGYMIFRPYFAVFAMAAIFAVLFFPIYKWILNKLNGREAWASLITVIIFVLVILVPLSNFVALLVKESIETFPLIEERISNGQLGSALETSVGGIRSLQEQYFPFFEFESLDIKGIVIDLGGALTSFIIKNANVLLAGTTNFVVSLFFMLITMYYLFKDGKKFFERVVFLTPLSNKYDKILFNKFRDVSKSTILGTLVTATIQGILGSIAYLIVGMPAFFLGVATAVASLIPIVGTALVWVPIAIVLAITGQWAAAIFLLIWGTLVIGLSDNIIRTKVIESKAKIHPLLIFFSIFGGLNLWGFLGIIFGPMVLAIILTVLHIYELEYEPILEK